MTENASASLAHAASVSPNLVKSHLARHHEELDAMLATPRQAGTELARRNADFMDELLRALCAAVHVERDGASLLVGAVGAYGRRLLGWKSDLDVCFVTRAAPEELQPIVDELLYPLWDAGVSVGHQVVALGEVSDAATSDLPTATELLDLRPLAGDPSLAHALRDCLFQSVFADGRVAGFVERLEERTAQRHERFGDSVYLLEPDVKNGAGGLRDLDFALWAAPARFHVRELPDLAAHGVLNRAQIDEAQRAVDFIWSVRNHLHALAGRKADRLSFVGQERVARALGYGERVKVDEPESSLQHTGAMIEAFMSDYYRHARVVTHVSEQVLGHAKRRPSSVRPRVQPLGAGLVTCAGGIGLHRPEALLGEPALALRLYVAAVTHALPVLSRSRDAVSQAASDEGFCGRLRADRDASAAFVQLVASHRPSPFRGRSIVSELHDVGLLLAMIPEFSPVVGRVHHDIYHVYTVDVHSVAAVDRLHALARGEHAAIYPLGSRLAAEIARPKMLALATLLHDVGKAIGGHNHAQRGAEMARDILRRLGLPDEDVDDACHLILKHLALYMVAARRDLADPATIEDFAREVRGREGLRDLYLLTVADLSTTSPTAMTKWKAGMVDALWRATDAQLGGETAAEPDRIVRVREQARACWPARADERLLEEYLDTMPERYLIANSPAEIVAHALVATEPREGAVAATLVASELEDVMELCVVTEGRASAGVCVVAGDRPGLLAAIAAAISANRLRIQTAQIHSRPLRAGGLQAVDLFSVHVPREDELTLEERMTKLRRDLNAVIGGELAPRDLLERPRGSRWSERLLPAVESKVVIEHHASSQFTIIEVLALDRPALLFDMAEALHALGLTIRVAKISTEGTRVIDVFYVNEADGSKLAPGLRTETVRAELLATLERQPAV